MATRVIDIAKAADVSPSAVSLVLNNRPGVSGEVRQRIMDIARNLGYRSASSDFQQVENITIKFLKIAKHGHIVNERHNAFITEYLEGIEQGTKRHNYKLEISFFNKTPVEEIVDAELHSRDQGMVDGLIVLGTELSARELTCFTILSRPMVFIDTYCPLAVFDCIDMDNTDGVFRSVQYLYQMGHRSIGLVKSSYETQNFKMREEGFREAMAYFSLPVQEKFTISIDPAYEQAVADMNRFLDESRLVPAQTASGGDIQPASLGPQPEGMHAQTASGGDAQPASLGSQPEGTHLPSAFFCMNDIIAYGCMRALREKGFRIPDDVSITGFDDLPSSGITEPPLTSIRVSTQQIGERALERLSGRINGTVTGQPEKILVSGKLMIRSSVKQL